MGISLNRHFPTNKEMGLSSKFLVYLLLAALHVLISYGRQVHHYDFVLKNTNFTRLCTTKSMFTVNESFPGPEIRVRKGDLVFVNVYNQGDYGVTLHWHGIKQPRNPWSDGPENVTQCPIQPGTNFTYEVVLSDEEGTLWWHSHSDWTRASVYGAIVILPALGTTYPFPEPYGEDTIIIGSWFNADVKAMIENINIGGDPPLSDAFTINGQPGDLYNCSNETTYRLKVEPGKTYLLRLINDVLNEEHYLAIANHTFTVVGQDGAYLKPFNTSYIMITPGQTIDVLVTMDQTPGQYYIASHAYADFAPVPYDDTTTTAILEYYGNYTVATSPSFPAQLPLTNDTDAAMVFLKLKRNLHDHVNVPKNITTSIYMAIALNTLTCDDNVTCLGDGNTVAAASLNNISYMSPTIDILQAYYRNWRKVYSTEFPDEPPYFYNFTGFNGTSSESSPGTMLTMLNYGEAVEIVFQGTNVQAAMNHPMHLHGYSFYLVGFGYGNFDNATDPLTYNFIDPPEINTIGVPKNGWATIRFFANNPGVWYMHCHLERHFSWGMNTEFIVRDGPTRKTSMRPRPAYMPPCTTDVGPSTFKDLITQQIMSELEDIMSS